MNVCSSSVVFERQFSSVVFERENVNHVTQLKSLTFVKALESHELNLTPTLEHGQSNVRRKVAAKRWMSQRQIAQVAVRQRQRHKD